MLISPGMDVGDSRLTDSMTGIAINIPVAFSSAGLFLSVRLSRFWFGTWDISGVYGLEDGPKKDPARNRFQTHAHSCGSGRPWCGNAMKSIYTAPIVRQENTVLPRVVICKIRSLIELQSSAE